MISSRILRFSDYVAEHQSRERLLLDYSLGTRRKARLAMRGVYNVGTISGVDSLQSTQGFTGTLRRANVVTGGADFSYDISRSVSYPWTYGSSGAGAINQVVEVIFTATKNTTTTLTLDAVLTSRVGDLLATFTLIKELKIEYLTAAQDPTNGNASTGTITISPGATNPIVTSPLGTAETMVLKPGAMWHWIDQANGMTVSSTAKTFDILHSDNVLDAKLRILALGFR